MCYEELLLEADELGLIVAEKPLKYNDGRIKGKRIAIRQDIPTSIEKKCVLAEELGHYYKNVGNILDQTRTANRKQEHIARVWAYNKLVTFDSLVDAFEYGCSNKYEYAEYIGVTEQFLLDSIEQFKQKYGCYKKIGNYIFVFYPYYNIIKII